MNEFSLCVSEVFVGDSFGCQLLLYATQVKIVWVAVAVTCMNPQNTCMHFIPDKQCLVKTF